MPKQMGIKGTFILMKYLNETETIECKFCARLASDMKRRFTLTQAAAKIGIKVLEMNRELRRKGYFRKVKYNNNEPLEYLQNGHLFLVEDKFKGAKMKCPRRQTYVTWVGIQWIKGVLEELLIEKGIIDLADTGFHNDF